MRKTVYLLFIVLLSACGNQTPDQNIEAEAAFFPLADFVNGELHTIDSLKLNIVKYTSAKGKTSSRVASFDELKKAAEELTEPDITASPLKNKYKEQSFADQSVPNITLTYATADKSLEVQRLDIILEPKPEENDRIKSLYLEKNKGGLQLKLLWTPDANFQIISNDSASTIVKFAWNLSS